MNKILACLFLSLLICICGSVTSGPLEKTKDYQKDFYMGVYIYDYHFAKVAEENNKDFISFFEEHLKTLNSHGINAIHLSLTRKDDFDKILKLCKKYDIKLIIALDFAYFRERWTEKEMDGNAKKAGEFIRKHVNESQVLAWGVCEELPREHINSLARYYTKILQYAPSAKFNLIHSSLGAAKDQPIPAPAISGTDRYAFWWETSGGGYIASPYSSLDWVRNQAASFQPESAKRGADFMLVITQGGLMRPGGANLWGNGDFDKIKYPSTLTEKEKVFSRVKSYAEQGRMGWKKFDTPEGAYYNSWKYYRLPPNCMKALAWTSVMEGARLFFCWSYSPPKKEILNLTFETAARKIDRKELSFITLAGRPGINNPQLEEFAEAGREIRKFSRLITTMSKQAYSPVVTAEKARFFNRAFTVPTIPGNVVVIHNGNTGKWPENSKYNFGDKDDIRIDDEGNMTGYIPFKEAMKVVFSVPDKEENEIVYDLASGKEINIENGKYSMKILPGSGTLIYIGTRKNVQKINDFLKKQ